MPDLAIQTLLDDRRIAYIRTDAHLKIIESGGATRLLSDHFDDRSASSLLEVLPELQGDEEALTGVLKGTLPRLYIPWLNRDQPDGSTRFLTLTVLPHRDAAGAIVGLLHVLQDVTEMGRLEQGIMQQRNELLLLQKRLHAQNRQLEAANIELHRLDELKSTFVSIAAHELRTPLASINGYLEMLLDGDAGALAPLQAEWIRIIGDSAGRLLRITSDLLDVTRIEAGRLELVLRPTDLAAIVRAVTVEQAPQLETCGQHLQLKMPASIPLALCDPMRATQIIANLLSNACKYSSPDSTITIRLKLADDPGFIQVSVSDQGPGISAEHQTQLFAPFYRTPTRATAHISGTGLGLYICRALVELHGGRIWLDSAPGQGATFHVTFPQATDPAEPET